MLPPITLTSPVPPEDLLFESMSSHEGLSKLGEMQLGLLSPRRDIDPDLLLGKPLRVNIELPDGQKRHFHGYVTRFSIGVHRGRYFSYQATVRPWLWFLTRTSDCRIFQDQTVPEIVKTVLQEHGTANFEFRLFRTTYRKWVYCVQYRETDFNFISRLLEHEGIYWYFEHGVQGHKLVLVDSQSVHPSGESLPYVDDPLEAPPDTDYVSHWSSSREVQPGKFVLGSYDFERPAQDLTVAFAKPRSHDLADYEMYDFQGDYAQRDDGSQWAEDRLDELHASFHTLRARSNAHRLEVGRLFQLARHPREDQNIEYLVTSLSIQAQVNRHEAGSDAGAFACEFTAIPSKQQYRPPRQTPKPIVQGPQTAVVVGPPGEELHTDAHGRVRVCFHWDRYHDREEDSSCWIRVSHPWAGKAWGAVSIPRIGQEVIVDFLEGDPDQPIVTGRVYNAEQGPPFALPGAAVISGIKSKTHKGTGYNEMTMDDTAGKEKLNIHAQYDMSTMVKHDQTNTVDNKFTETIKSDAKITVTEGTYSHDVAANTATYHVKGALKETYDATQTTTVKDAITIVSTGGPIAISADAKHVYINAGTNIQLHVGASMIWMDAGGQINIKGVNVAINGSSNVTIKGGIVHSEAQSEHQTKGAIVLSEGSATNTVKGGMVMLNP